MTRKATPVSGLLADRDASPTVRALLDIADLKQLFREGWLRRGLDPARAESVADHSFGVAALALVLTPALRPDLDAGRVLRMAVAHDLGEIHAGDLVPADGVAPRAKHRREAEGVARLAAGLPGDAGSRLRSLWDEAEARRSPEARFVRQLDRLEMALQATAYQLRDAVDAGEFLRSARRDIDDPGLLDLLDALERLTEP